MFGVTYYVTPQIQNEKHYDCPIQVIFAQQDWSLVILTTMVSTVSLNG